MSRCVGNFDSWGASPDHGLALPLPALHRIGWGLDVALLVVGVEGRKVCLWGHRGLDVSLLVRDGLVGPARAKFQWLHLKQCLSTASVKAVKMSALLTLPWRCNEPENNTVKSSSFIQWSPAPRPNA